jgi:hypothetical protein
MRSQVLTEDGQDYVAGVNVVIVDQSGKNLMDPVKTAEDGSFDLPDNLLTDTDGKQVKIYGKGIRTKIFNAALIGPYAIKVTLDPSVVSDQDRADPVSGYSIAIAMGMLSLFCFIVSAVIKK